MNHLRCDITPWMALGAGALEEGYTPDSNAHASVSECLHFTGDIPTAAVSDPGVLERGATVPPPRGGGAMPGVEWVGGSEDATLSRENRPPTSTLELSCI